MLLNIKSMDKFVPYYTSKEQALKWKKLGLSKHSPHYPMIKIKDIIITKGNKEKYEEENYNKFNEYSCAAEPPVRCGVSHLSRRNEPLYIIVLLSQRFI